MKRIKILLMLIFSMMLVLSSCTINTKTDTPQPIKTLASTQIKTIPVSSTPTALPTKTLEATPITIKITPSPGMTATSRLMTVTTKPTYTDLLDGKLIVLRDFNANYLEDILTGIGYNMLAEGKAIDILRWTGNGCTLIAATTDEIIEMDLQGKIIRNIFSFERLPDYKDEYILIDPPYYRRAIDMLAPDESWLIYRLGSGKYEQQGSDFEPYRFEYENLEAISVDGLQGPYRLSQNGGAWRAAWSPDSQRIAYSDYDDKGVHQLFLINKYGTNRKQITYFYDPTDEILKIIWSPQGDKIALLVGQESDWSVFKTVVIDVERNKFPKEVKNIYVEWWWNNDSFFAWKIIDKESSHAEYILVDISPIGIFSYSRLPFSAEECYRINPFGNPSMVGCLTYDGKFIVYDTNTSNVVEYPNFDPHHGTQYWIAAPDTYPGVIGCGFTP
jgi:hypothetical protein